MAIRVEQYSLPLHAATDLPPYVPVAMAAIASTYTGGNRSVTQAGTTSLEPIGVTIASALGLNPVRVLPIGNIAKGVCNASLAAGVDVAVSAFASQGIPSSSGSFSQAQLGPAAAASGTKVWRVGKSLEAANPGEVFAFYVSPLLLSGGA